MRKEDLDLNIVPKNSSMAADEKEMERLGKQMEKRRTNKELKKEYQKIPDPIQHK
ncbi:MAG TPA: hypothetical protein VEV44_13025 [Pseudoneobacillus sp.]|nr:hypothetical protein [Pseudoneobacillus sp.]